jgi:hypothetical protein
MLGIFWDSVRSNPGPLIGVLFTTATLVFVLLFAHKTNRPEIAKRYLIEEEGVTDPVSGSVVAADGGVTSDVTNSGPKGA